MKAGANYTKESVASFVVDEDEKDCTIPQSYGKLDTFDDVLLLER